MKHILTQLWGMILLLFQWYNLGPIQRKWLWSLIIHPKRQTKNQLGIKYHNDKYKACCLGELGLIAKICEWQNESLYEIGSGDNWGNLKSSYEKVGLYGPLGENLSENSQKYLAYLNDRNKTWPQIAVIVLKKPINYLKAKV